MQKLFILGAADPEMNRIEEVLAANKPFAYATVDGKRCHGGNAYKADSHSQIVLPVALSPDELEFVFVECAIVGRSRDVMIDHHREGDPGFGKGAEDYLLASSLGQLLALLSLDATPEDLLIAASDHCPGPAYRGECLGVQPDDLLAFRARNAATFRAKEAGAIFETDPALAVEIMAQRIKNEIVLAAYALAGARTIPLGRWNVPDLRNGTPQRPGQPVASLPEAALRTGEGYIASVKDRDGRTKVVLGGDNEPETVQAFLAWAKVEGLVDPYGVPARGFAGAYAP